MLKFYKLEPVLVHPLAHFSVGAILAFLSRLPLFVLTTNLYIITIVPVLVSFTAGLFKEVIDKKLQGEFNYPEFIGTVLGGMFVQLAWWY